MEDEHLRTAVLAFALVSLVVGAIFFHFGIELVRRLSYEALVSLEVVGRLALYAVLFLFFVHGYRVVRHRYRHPIEEARPPNREAAPRVGAPEDDLRRSIDSIRHRSDPAYASIRDRVRRQARWVLESTTDGDPADALAAGTWTDDEVAAATLGSSITPDRSLADRLRRRFDFEAIYARRELRRAMGAVARAGGVAVDDAYRPGGPATPENRAENGPKTAPEDAAPREGSADANADTDTIRRRTGHWDGVGVIAIVGLTLGVYYQLPSLLLAAAVGIGFAAYSRFGSDPDVAVTLERVVSDPEPDPGDAVTVEVRIRNDGSRRLADLRFVDGVPSALSVADGSPRLGTVVRSGGVATVRYSITARRGEFEFEPAHLIARTVTGATEVERRLSPDQETTITCLPTVGVLDSVESVLPDRGLRYAGTLSTETPGQGVEFHGVRDYQAGDPVAHIDWNRYARTRELTTVSSVEERSATVVVAVDTRPAAYLAPAGTGFEHAVDRSVAGATAIFGSLLSDGHSVGLASVGPDAVYLSPGRGDEHRYRGRRLLGTAEAFSPSPPADSTVDLDQFERVPPGAQVVFVSPLCDDESAALVREFRRRGFAVTILSPDPTTATGPEASLLASERDRRIDELRVATGRIVEWDWEEPLERALGGVR
ncbi:MAG: DUF7269 family protein [Halobacteriota archaeon]